MTSSICWLMLSVLIFGAGAILSLLAGKSGRISIYLSGIVGIAGSIAGLIAALPVLLSGKALTYVHPGLFPFTSFSVRLDPLAAFMVAVIALLMLAAAIYSFSYVTEYEGRGAWSMGFFTNLFVGSMIALVAVDNAFYFLAFFELMSLSSYFLVIFEQDRKAVDAGFLYFLIAHAGSILIMGAFFIFWWKTGSLEFAAFRHAGLSAPLASAVFLLAFFGFGAKAGMVPLHSWLPRAHPAAPSHASALMSGVMVKIGIFGIIKVGIDLLGATEAWWGIVVLFFGGVSAVLGVMYALAEHDIKQLLAYHTVENIGIILMGVGTGMVGLAINQPVMAVLGILAGLYHLLNHAMFKGLLFLGAGSVIYRTHTRDMEELGGLTKRMPYTAMTFLVGAMAISALPPFNGFVSEWFTYQGLFTLSMNGEFMLRLVGPIIIVMLSLTGALAAMCFVKVSGITFSGAPRSPHASEATEVPVPMVIGMLILAALCVLLGVGAPWVSPVIAMVASSLANGVTASVADGSLIFPANPVQAALSTPFLTLLLLGAMLLPVVLCLWLKGTRMPRRHEGDAWACGYKHGQRMVVSAGGYAQPIRVMFSPLFRLREVLNPSKPLAAGLDLSIRGAASSEAVVDRFVITPIMRAAHWLGRGIQWLQHGDFRVYCLYVVAALVILILATV